MKDKAIIVEMLVDKVEDYAKTSIELYKLKAIDKSTDVFTAVASRAIIFAIIALFFLLMTLGLSFYLGDILGKTYYGFFTVGGFYFLIAGIFLIFRKSCIEVPLNDYIVRQIFHEKKR